VSQRRSHHVDTSEVGTISVIAITLRYVFALLHNALYLWRIVIASDSFALDFSRALSLLIVITLSLLVSVIAYFVIALRNIRKRYRFEESNDVISAITLPSS
jgi:hypothetical protein